LQIYIRILYYPATKLAMKLIGCSRSRALLKLFAATWAVFCFSVLAHAQIPAGSKPKAAADWLTRAADLSDIRAPGSHPFTLRGHVRIRTAAGGYEVGTYRLDWNSASQWREELAFADFKRLRIGGPEKYWEETSQDLPPVAMLQFDRLFNFVKELREQTKWVAGRVREQKSKGGPIECVSMEKVNLADLDHDYCFDPGNGTLSVEMIPSVANEVRLGVEGTEHPFFWDQSTNGKMTPDELLPTLAGEGGMGLLETTHTFASFVHWDGKLFPMEMSVWSGEVRLVGFVMDELDALQPGDPDRFTPPAGADEWVQCEDPQLARAVYDPSPIYPPPGFEFVPSGFAVISGVIEVDGHFSGVGVLESTLPGLGDRAKSAVSEWKFEPPACHGQPYRERVYFSFFRR
jgi:hypothetical protein